MKQVRVVIGMAIALSSCSSPDRESAAPGTADDLFVEAAAARGLDFEHFLGSTGEFFFPETAAVGSALLDYDGDGDLDVFLPQGRLLDTSKPLSESRFPPPEAHFPGDRLFRNDAGEASSSGYEFVDVTAAAGIGLGGYGMGTAVGDYDGDGDTDLYVTRFDSNTLYRNNGDGTFADVTRTAGVDDERWSASAAFLDYDRDGDLDLFVTNYADFTVAGARPCAGATGDRDYCGPLSYEPLPDRLFRNDGGDRFTDVTVAAGIDEKFGTGLGVVAADFDDDGWADLYVANDQRDNQLWHNLGDGTFENIGLISGTAYNQNGEAEASMGVAVADVDDDGDEDILVTHLSNETNTLYENRGGGLFVDVTLERGLAASSRPFTGFGAVWLDFDHDGVLDLYVANGAVKKQREQRNSVYPFQQKNQLLQGRGEGRFEDVSAAAGAALELFDVSRGLAVGDLDNDGDIDILVSNTNGPVRLLENRLPLGGNWLLLAAGSAPGAREVGTRFSIRSDDGRTLTRRLRTDGSYLSAHDPRVHFGLGRSAEATVEIRWPSGLRSRALALPSDSRVTWIAR